MRSGEGLGCFVDTAGPRFQIQLNSVKIVEKLHQNKQNQMNSLLTKILKIKKIKIM